MKIRPIVCALLFGALSAKLALGTVFLSEFAINPPSSSDDTKEFIELMGTPGMKLDGYAIAVINGAQRKNHPDSPIPPNCSDDPAISECTPEVDEFFSLDGLSLGANGLLVLGIGFAGDYSITMLSDTNARYDWTNHTTGIWNGHLDWPGKMANDGSCTLMLIRNRPGDTEANCPVGTCGNLRWGKDIACDTEVLPTDPPMAGMIRYGNGNLDRGDSDNNGGFTLDLKGASTLPDVNDDLEIVDEVSFESDQGQEYDEDDRHVDNGSPSLGLKTRNVHALGDPQGFNPDCISRVDYRTKGAGYPPVSGATGEMGNGNNWQDTATEQWIRGESKTTTGSGSSPPFFYSNAANINPDSIQPYRTNVPLWLADGNGTDFDFVTTNSYQIMAGRTNPLAVPYIPGDTDRDGDCDTDDIAKLAAVFGNDNWIFSNAFEDAPESDSGDPATQTRPWDVDATGNNGIEPSDLQWTLNFQGNTNGRIVGVRYDSATPTPLGSGVVLNSNAGTTCTITAAASNPCGRALSSLLIGDTVEVTVRAQVTAGANLTAGSENGVMQFVHDVTVNTGGVLRLAGVQALGTFSKTRASIESPQGVSGDLGVQRINGYTTSFTQGLSSAADLYKVTFTAVAAGSAQISVAAASEAKFAASTPRGVKIGHTRVISPFSNGDPASASYPSAIAVTVTSGQIGDVNADTFVNLGDSPFFVDVLIGADTDPGRVQRSDMNCDGTANGLDVQPFVDAVLP